MATVTGIVCAALARAVVALSLDAVQAANKLTISAKPAAAIRLVVRKGTA